MKAFLTAFVYCVPVSVALAQIPVVGGPLVLDSDQMLQAVEQHQLLLEQLELLKASMPSHGRGCVRENRFYSEGALLSVGEAASDCTAWEWAVCRAQSTVSRCWSQ